jgi:hypothetical protein
VLDMYHSWKKLEMFADFLLVKLKGRSRDSSVDIPTGYGLDGRGSIPGRGKRFFCTPQGPDRSYIQWVPGALSPGVRRPGREADHSLPSNAEVKNGRGLHPLPHTSLWRGA